MSDIPFDVPAPPAALHDHTRSTGARPARSANTAAETFAPIRGASRTVIIRVGAALLVAEAPASTAPAFNDGIFRDGSGEHFTGG